MKPIRYTDIAMELAQKVTALCGQKGKYPVLIIRKSNHPEDAHLFLVLAESRRNPDKPDYLVWTYNESSASKTGSMWCCCIWATMTQAARTCVVTLRNG